MTTIEVASHGSWRYRLTIVAISMVLTGVLAASEVCAVVAQESPREADSAQSESFKEHSEKEVQGVENAGKQYLIATLENASPTGQKVQRLAFSSDASRLAVVDDQGAATIWDVSEERIVKTIEGVWPDFIAFTADNKNIVSVKEHTRIAFWDVESGEVDRHFDEAPAGIMRMTMSDDGTKIVTTDSNESITLWETKTGDSKEWFVRLAEQRLGDDDDSLDISADGKMILAGDCKGEFITLLDTDSGKQSTIDRGARYGDISNAQFLPDNNVYIRVVERGVSRKLGIWDIKEGKYSADIQPRTSNESGEDLEIYDVRLSQNGEYVVGRIHRTPVHPGKTTKKNLMLIEAKTGKVILSFSKHKVVTHEICPQARVVAAADKTGTIRLYQVRN